VRGEGSLNFVCWREKKHRVRPGGKPTKEKAKTPRLKLRRGGKRGKNDRPTFGKKYENGSERTVLNNAQPQTSCPQKGKPKRSS